jgi:hypothetical protein
VKIGCGLAEYSKEGCGSKRAVLPVMMVLLYMENSHEKDMN